MMGYFWSCVVVVAMVLATSCTPSDEPHLSVIASEPNAAPPPPCEPLTTGGICVINKEADRLCAMKGLCECRVPGAPKSEPPIMCTSAPDGSFTPPPFCDEVTGCDVPPGSPELTCTWPTLCLCDALSNTGPTWCLPSDPICPTGEGGVTKRDALTDLLTIWCQPAPDVNSCAAFIVGVFCPTDDSCGEVFCADDLATHNKCIQIVTSTGEISDTCLAFYEWPFIEPVTTYPTCPDVGCPTPNDVIDHDCVLTGALCLCDPDGPGHEDPKECAPDSWGSLVTCAAAGCDFPPGPVVGNPNGAGLYCDPDAPSGPCFCVPPGPGVDTFCILA